MVQKLKSTSTLVTGMASRRIANGRKEVKSREGPDKRRRGGHISTKGERGEGMKFSVENYATVASFEPGTCIRYGPNPKRPGSKSYTRYDGYCKAKTVGEALKLGSKPADLLWENWRGDYQILGTVRSEAKEIAVIGRAAFEKAKRVLANFHGPAGCPVNFTDPEAVAKQEKEEAWRAERLKRAEKKAKELKLSVETSAEIEASCETADIRLQRRVAARLSEIKLRSGKKITDADAHEVLSFWGFTENTARLNVMGPGVKYVYSDTVGAIRARSFGFGSTPPTKRYPAVPRLLCQWLADSTLPLSVKFVCTAINLNCNYAGCRHRDQNNEGPSVIRAFGNFKGGRLTYFPKDTQKNPRPNLDTLQKKDGVVFDLSKETVVFDGTRAHEVEAFEGERYSVVFFTAKGFQKGQPEDVKFLKTSCGFPFPTPADLSKLKKATGVV